MASALHIQERIPIADNPGRVDGEVLTSSRARRLALLNGKDYKYITIKKFFICATDLERPSNIIYTD